LEFLSSINSSQGYKTICNYLNVDENYLLKQLEPYLLKMNLINKGSKGRRITDKGISYLKGQER
jgi:Holliday junction DNA helicase RuvB